MVVAGGLGSSVLSAAGSVDGSSVDGSEALGSVESVLPPSAAAVEVCPVPYGWVAWVARTASTATTQHSASTVSGRRPRGRSPQKRCRCRPPDTWAPRLHACYVILSILIDESHYVFR